MPIDAARRQLGPLTVGNDQCRIYWLVDPTTTVIEDARFIAYGELSSHPIADVFTESVRGRTVADACRLSREQLEVLLRDDAGTPAFADLKPFSFIADLQAKAEAALPAVVVPPKPDEKPVYQRKRKADWTDADAAWFGLSYMKKIERVDAVMRDVLHSRLEDRSVGWDITGLHDDFRVVIRFKRLKAEQVPTISQFLEDALRGRVHAQLSVEAEAL